MIPIVKTNELTELNQLRLAAELQNLSPEEAYKSLRNPLKQEVLAKLVEEQGGLCAYCMCRIPSAHLDDGITPISLEHIFPRNPEDGLNRNQGLDYRNLVAVCHGNKGLAGTRRFLDLTCDVHKGNMEFRRLNPCEKSTLSSIYYDYKGKIFAENAEVSYDLDDVLNLNSETAPLVEERKSALESLLQDMETALNQGQDLTEYCNDRLVSLQQEHGFKVAYVGILIWYLESTIEALSS